MKKAKIISVQAKKGGAGKSETSLNLAYGLASRGKKVLTVDFDPQANLTDILLGRDHKLSQQGAEEFLARFEELREGGQQDFLAAYQALGEFVKKSSFEYDINKVILKKCDIKDAILKTRVEGFDLVPADNELSTADIELKSQMNPANRLRISLKKVESEYDYIIIDNQPFENALTYNSMSACYKEGDLILVPIKINRGGLIGTYDSLTTCLKWLEEYEPLPFDIKLLVTMKNKNNIDNRWVESLKTAFGDFMFETVIPYQAKPVEEASIHQKVLLENDKSLKSNVAQRYNQLVEEILNM